MFLVFPKWTILVSIQKLIFAIVFQNWTISVRKCAILLLVLGRVGNTSFLTDKKHQKHPILGANKTNIIQFWKTRRTFLDVNQYHPVLEDKNQSFLDVSQYHPILKNKKKTSIFE